MIQAITGVSPAATKETLVMTVWPSHCITTLGKWLGQAYSIDWPGVYFFRIGNLLALLSIPIALKLYFFCLLPWVALRYSVTNRRVIVYRGLFPAQEERSVALDAFDRIDIVVQPGEEWYRAGDLVFYRGNVETFRLEAIAWPDAFRHTILKTRLGFVGVAAAEAAGVA